MKKWNQSPVGWRLFLCGKSIYKKKWNNRACRSFPIWFYSIFLVTTEPISLILFKTVVKIFVIEVILFFIFWLMKFYKGGKFKNNFFSMLKGWLERGFICFGLLYDLEIIIVFFSALKIGTRLHEESSPSIISNDQFLIWNILSVTAGIIYSILIKSFLL